MCVTSYLLIILQHYSRRLKELIVVKNKNNKKLTQCKVCESFEVVTHTEESIIKYKSIKLSVDIWYCICNNCGREFIPKRYISLNDEFISKAKIEADK